MISSQKSQQGAVLIVVLLLLMIMMILAISLSSTSSTHSKMVNNSVLKTQAFQIAESGSDAVLSYLIDDDKAIDKIKEKTCDKAFTDQFKIGDSIKTAEGTDINRKIQLSWYACFPKDGKVTDCDGGKCFALVISGRACVMNGAAVDDKSCVVSRHLQGYQISSQ